MYFEESGCLFENLLKDAIEVLVSNLVAVLLAVAALLHLKDEVVCLCLVGNAVCTWRIQVGAEGAECFAAQIIVKVIAQTDVVDADEVGDVVQICLLYTSPSPRDTR